MIRNIDHITLVVTNLDEAKHFFGLLGFNEIISVEISGKEISDFMQIPNLKAEHLTLVIEESNPKFEIQLLKFYHPVHEHHNPSGLNKTGYNHICFKVDNLEQEIKRLKNQGVEFLNEVMNFHQRKLVFLKGPDNTVIELAEYI